MYFVAFISFVFIYKAFISFVLSDNLPSASGCPIAE